MRNQSTWRSVRLAQSRLEQTLHRRHSLRLHGLVIGAVTLGCMLAASAAQRALGVESLALRYAVSLGIGYGIYPLVLRWWAGRLVDDDDDQADASDALDLLDLVPTGGGRGGGGGATLSLRPGGGGDATADFGSEVGSNAAEGMADALGSAASRAVGAVAETDEASVVLVPVVAVFLAAIATVLGAGALAWLCFGWEVLLAVAVEVAFSVAAARTAGRLAREGWLAAALRLTWKPLLGALVCAVALGAAIDFFVPKANSLGEAVKLLILSGNV